MIIKNCSLVFLMMCFSFISESSAYGASNQEVDVKASVSRKIKVGIGQFSGDRQQTEMLSRIIRSDLNRTSLLQVLDNSQLNSSASQRPNWEKWREFRVDFIVGGDFDILPDGKLRGSFRIWDVDKMSEVGARQLESDKGALRQMAHALADLTLMVITGVNGGFGERRLSVAKRSNRYVLEITDSDGINGQTALSSPKPILMPTWFPQREHITYISLEAAVPMIWVQDVKTARRLPAGSANVLGAQCADQVAYLMTSDELIPSSQFDEDWRNSKSELCAAELLRVAPIGMQELLKQKSSYADKVRRTILPNIIYAGKSEGNPKVEISLELAPDGRIIKYSISKSSGNADWDLAAVKGVLKTERLPVDIEGRVPPSIVLVMRPLD